MNPSYHIPVMLQETIEHLRIRGDGAYVDCTYGGGGHSSAILERLGPKGRLIAFDQDKDATRNVSKDPRLQFVNENFRHLLRFLRLHAITSVDGILADLGVSSHQFDVPDRGFSTRFEGPLDMRMDQRQSLTAANVVNAYTELQLHKLFEQYGEVTNAKTLARTIIAARSQTPISTVEGFKNAVASAVKGNPNKYFAQVFQALRIEVNGELDALKELLQQVPGALTVGGRLVIITFHSLEDRLVKNFIRSGGFDEPADDPFTMRQTSNPLKAVFKKPLVPAENEMNGNPRARSAKMRVAEKTSE